MNKWIKRSLILGAVVVFAMGLAAFRPWGGDTDEDGISDYTETLADVLGISVEELQEAEQAAKEAAVAQAVEDGALTQEQADAMLEGDFGGRGAKGAGKFGSSAYLAEALGITEQALQEAQQEAMQRLMAQAVEDGTLSQEDYDMMQARSGVQPYFEDVYQQAYQDAVDAALADGAITQEQADLLLKNMPSGGHGFGGMRMPGGHDFGKPFPGRPGGDEDTSTRFPPNFAENAEG